jgi:hypothetical protein
LVMYILLVMINAQKLEHIKKIVFG